MYEITVEAEFAAAHAIVMAGQREPVHGHNWKVTVTLRGDSLDDDGLLCDFHAIENALRETVRPFHNRDLNATPPFDRRTRPRNWSLATSPTRWPGRSRPRTRRGVRLASVRVTEAPGCAARYTPPQPGTR